MKPDELNKEFKDREHRRNLFDIKYGRYIANIKLGSCIIVGMTLSLAVYYMIGRLLNVCEIVRWIFCKSC